VSKGLLPGKNSIAKITNARSLGIARVGKAIRETTELPDVQKRMSTQREHDLFQTRFPLFGTFSSLRHDPAKACADLFWGETRFRKEIMLKQTIDHDPDQLGRFMG
jgi:hypothetical protein